MMNALKILWPVSRVFSSANNLTFRRVKQRLISTAVFYTNSEKSSGAEMEKPIFILLFVCFGCSTSADVSAIQIAQTPTVQASNSLEDQVDILKDSLVEFYSQFQLKELEVDLRIQNGGKKVPMIKGRGSCFSDGSLRWLEAIQRRRGTVKVVDAKELLMLSLIHI